MTPATGNDSIPSMPLFTEHAATSFSGSVPAGATLAKVATRKVLDRSGRAEEVALATLFLASDSSFWVTDVTLDVAGAGSWTDGCLVRGNER